MFVAQQLTRGKCFPPKHTTPNTPNRYGRVFAVALALSWIMGHPPSHCSAPSYPNGLGACWGITLNLCNTIRQSKTQTHHEPCDRHCTHTHTHTAPESDEQDVIDGLIEIDLRILTTDQYNSNSGRTHTHSITLGCADVFGYSSSGNSAVCWIFYRTRTRRHRARTDPQRDSIKKLCSANNPLLAQSI